MIPFLRKNDDEVPKPHSRKMRSLTTKKYSDTANSPLKGVSPKRSSIGFAEYATHHLKKRENNWDSYVKPISFFNERVHKSMKIGFE